MSPERVIPDKSLSDVNRKTPLLIAIVVGLLITLAIVVCTALWINSPRAQQYMNRGASLSDGTDYHGMWLNGELEYVVFETPGALQVRHTQSSQWKGMTPSKDGLTLIPEGLWYNGAPVDTSSLNKVFVLQKNGVLRPAAVEEKYLAYLALSKITDLEQSPVWPFLKAEIHKGE